MKILTCIFFLTLSFAQAQTKKAAYPKVLNEFIEKNKFDRDKIYAVSYSDNPDFIHEITENNLIGVFGVLQYDKFYSANVLENAGCSGQQLVFVKNFNLENLNGIDKNLVKVLSEINVDPEKKVVVFLCANISSKSMLKHLIKPVFNEVKKDANYDYIMLVID
ncbi:hypothetical protein [Flavobacterium sp. I3-2]|uniref:hypothetical protein n=1 Tax=Flavobacterium sp. I3-2 TaxID=2748319 RepID=UPI0015AC3737|nr:hypothetical protein [Flavobacterium sp. I3-2]